MRPLLERLGGFLPAAIALALPTAFLPGAVDLFILPRASLVIAGACLGIGIALLAPGGLGLGRLRTPLVAAAAAAILAFAFSVSWPLSFAGSYTRYESLPIRLSYLGLLAATVWLLRDKRSRDWVVAAFVLGTSVASVAAIIQYCPPVAATVTSCVPASFRPDGNLGNANLLGALIAMALPLSVAGGLRRGRFMIAWWVGAAVIAGGLVASTSRSGGLGALAGCVALVVFALRGRIAAGAAIVSVGLLGAALLAIVLSPLRLLNNDPGPVRLHLWPDALHMVAARPLTGWGEDATGLVFGRFLSADWLPGITIDRAHAGPLDLGATQGLLGLAALAWFLLVLFRGAWRWRFVGRVGPLAAACVGYTVWVLFNFDWAPATGAFWLLAGTAWSGIRTAETEELSHAVESTTARSANGAAVRGGTAWRSLVAVGLALVAVWLGVLPVLADVWYSHSRLDLAVVVDPLQAHYHRLFGEGLVATGATTHGVDEMRLAARLGEPDPWLYLELGDAELRLGETAQAHSDFRTALAIDPYFAPARQRLAGV
ncbi:MAG TPA: O-antigen ligase family protein [Candidatus Dormibacteraeota bacterium]|nr:O-antigen ligase family protein [Candidatus Dormibacteraeota bacterium]